MNRWMHRARIGLATMAVGGAPLVLDGCDTTVRDTVLAGVEGASSTLATTFIQAFFESLNEEEEDVAGGAGTI